MATSYLYEINPANLQVIGVTAQAAAHGSLTFHQNRFFAAIGESVDLKRNLEILDTIEWLMTEAIGFQETSKFPRPVAAGITARYGDVISTSLGMKGNSTLLHNATRSDPLVADLNACYWGYTGSAGAGLNQAVQLAGNGHRCAFAAFKSYILIGANSPFV